MLQSQGLRFAYNSSQKFEFPDISCPAGTHIVILGESGKGKTTLLHLLAGFLRPAEGQINIADQDITGLSAAELDHFRGKNIGIIFQKSHFIGALNVVDNLLMAQYLANVKQDSVRIKQLLERLNLGHKLQQKPKRLSQGEQQRVAIARAMLNQPNIILADEPTSALDDTNCEEVIHLLKEEAAEAGASLIIVTHDQRLKDQFERKVEL